MKVFAFLLLVAAMPGVPAAAQTGEPLRHREALQHYRAGYELMLAERYDDAVEEFTSAIDLNPLLTLAHYGRGQSYMNLRRYASAVQAFIACRDAYARIAALRQEEVAESNRLQTDEVNELRDAIRRMQSQVNVNSLTAFRLEQRLEELDTLRRGVNFGAVMRIPAEVSLALGSAYFRAGHASDAEREWKAAVAVDAKLGEAHNNLAALYAVTGRKQEALAAVRAAERARFRVHPQLKADVARMP